MGPVHAQAKRMVRCIGQPGERNRKNYGNLLSLYWHNNDRFRKFTNVSEWLDEIQEQQDSPDVTVRRAWGKELEKFNLNYSGKSGFSPKSQDNLRIAVLSFIKYHIGEPEEYDFTIGTQEQLKQAAREKEQRLPPRRQKAI